MLLSIEEEFRIKGFEIMELDLEKIYLELKFLIVTRIG